MVDFNEIQKLLGQFTYIIILYTIYIKNNYIIQFK